MSESATASRDAIPARLNGALSSAVLALALFQLLAVPLLLPHHWAWGLAALMASGFTTLHWSLVHEAIHGLLQPGHTANERLGRLLCVALAVPFQLVRLGHLEHHRHNRFRLDRPEVYDPARSSWFRAAPVFYARLCGGLYVGEIVAVPLFGLPRPWLKRLIERLLRGDDADVQAVRRQVVAALTGSRLSRIRADALVTILLYGTSLWLYGAYWPWLVAQLAVRGFLISVLDNAFHYGTPLDSGRDALNFALPRFWARAILNFNYHHAHHHRPSLSWIALPSVEPGLRQSSHPFLGGLARQFRGPTPLDAVLR